MEPIAKSKRALLAMFVVIAVAMPSSFVAGAEGWNTFLSEEGGFDLQYPIHLTITKDGEGTTCINKVCQPRIAYVVKGLRSEVGKVETYAHLSIQKGVIPKDVAIDQYYQSQFKRPLAIATESVVLIGTLRALRIKGLVEHTTGILRDDGSGTHVLDPQSAKRVQKPEDRLLVVLHGVDLLTIVSSRPQTEFDATFEKMLLTIRQQ